ncbi:MAG TPA: AMP-binding protein [Nitrososphaerales archaeon]|nr:AMP-binding protein [Nitrososphaerales archaeon]
MKKQGIKSFKDLWSKSISDPAWFWASVSEDLDIRWFEQFTDVLDESSGIQWSRWFLGGKTNIALNCLDKHATDDEDSARTALISETENASDRREVTYAELHALANQIANALISEAGIKKQDRVGIYMPMIPEAVAAFFAVLKIGAIVVPVFSGYGSEAISSRLRDCEASAILTAESYFRRGNRINMKETAIEAARSVPSLRSVLILDRASVPAVASVANQELGPAVKIPQVIHWATVLSHSKSFDTLPMDSEDPFMIIYTSGTTGRPKGAVHVHGGFLVKIAEEVAYQGDVKKEDLLFWFTDMGWIMAPWELVGGLCLGCTVVLYDGAPDYPNPDRLWEVVEKDRVTFLGVSPTLIRALMKYGMDPVKKHDLTSLRAFGSTGEPWNPESYNWLFDKVGNKTRPIVNLSGGTEVGACFLSVHPIMPLKECSLGGPCLGIDADVFGEDGTPLRAGETGELVIRRPWPSITRGLWKNPQRYIETYWSRFPGTWVHGDWASKDEDGYWFLHGRSDDTIKIAGKRVGPAEIESALASHQAVLESVAIGVPDKLKGEAAVCFVVLRPGFVPSEELRAELKQHAGRYLGESLKPAQVRFVTSIPKTRNAKLIRRLAKAAYLGLPQGDISNLENPEALDAVTNSK